MRIEVLVFDGFDELDSLAPFEVFANAAQIVPDLEVSLVTATGQAQVTGSHGVRFTALRRWAPEEADVLLVPGGGFADPGPGVRDLIAEGTLPADLRRLRPRQVLASVCTGAMLLAAAGLLKGRPATTHPIAYDALTAAGAELSKTRVVDDGDIVTS